MSDINQTSILAQSLGDEMMTLAKNLFPLNRSLTGDGVRESLAIIKSYIPNLSIYETPSGTQVGDWVVPLEWKIRKAYIQDLTTGHRVVDLDLNNLHVVGYSTPVDLILSRDQLEDHLYSLPDQPEAIPYVTSYYQKNWGFCLSHNARESMGEGPFHVLIDSELFDGSMTYAELVLPGRESKEVLLSTYLCHPSLANNELSGPIIWTFLISHLQQRERRFTYRCYIGPETIGAINYIHSRREELRNVVAGWVLTCIGDNGPFSYLESRLKDSLSNRIGRAVVESQGANHAIHSFLDRGSDERQFCSPGVDLPIGSFMRTKYGLYPEYHTSLDDLSILSPESLNSSLEMMKLTINVLEANESPKLRSMGEPFMSKYGLYPTVSKKSLEIETKEMMNVLAYMDGEHDLLDIGAVTGIDIQRLLRLVDTLKLHGVID